jgi:putative glutamine amidotransferase
MGKDSLGSDPCNDAAVIERDGPGRIDYAGAPLIGVTTSEVRLAEKVPETPRSDPPRTEMALGLTYLKALQAAGGLPVVIPPLPESAIPAMLEDLDAICLSGGPDIHPSAYGREPHPALGPTWRELDESELALARAADACGKPILAICRGAQALNVARGGTLFQHLPDEVGDSVQHRQREIGSEPSHRIEIEPDSKLAAAIGDTSIEVNSFHHQAPEQLGRDLRAVAWSPDGVIEGLEDNGERFVIGVQWHAEALYERSEDARLFRAFVAAAHEVPARSGALSA